MGKAAVPLTRVLAASADPVMQAAGFKRRGKTFTRPHASGDQEFVDFQSITSFHPFVTFRVTIGVDLQLSRDVFYQKRARMPVGPPIALPLWESRIYPDRAGQQGDWVYNGEDPAEAAWIGAALAQALGDDFMPVAEHLSDLGRLEAELRKAGTRWGLPGKVYFGRPNERALAMVIASQRKDSEVDDIVIAQMDRAAAGGFDRIAVGYLPSLIERLSSGDYPHRSPVLQDLWDEKTREGGREWASPE